MQLACVHRGKAMISALQHAACRLSDSVGRPVGSPGPGGLSRRRHLIRHRDHLRLAARPDRVLHGELRDQFRVGLRLALLGGCQAPEGIALGSRAASGAGHDVADTRGGGDERLGPGRSTQRPGRLPAIRVLERQPELIGRCWFQEQRCRRIASRRREPRGRCRCAP